MKHALIIIPRPDASGGQVLPKAKAGVEMSLKKRTLKKHLYTVGKFGFMFQQPLLTPQATGIAGK